MTTNTMKFNTLDSSMQSMNLDEGPYRNLSDLTLVVEEFGQEADSEFASNLIVLDRFVELAEDCQLRIGAVDAKPIDARIYLMNDLIIVGKYKKKKKGKKTLATVNGATQDKIVFGAGNFDTLTADNVSVGGQSKASKAREGSSLKLKLWVDLGGSGVQVRDIHKGENCGIRIIYTTKETIEDEDGGIEFITNVDQTEVYFESKAEMETFSTKIHDIIDALIEKQLEEEAFEDGADGIDFGSRASMTSRSKPSMASVPSVEAIDDDQLSQGDGQTETGTLRSNSTLRTGKSAKKRSYGKAKATMKKIQQARNQGKSLGKKGDTSGPLTLEDLESKYKIELKPKAQQDLAEFSVTFKQGSMGFALSSSKQEDGQADAIVVFVGKIEENGMADASGVTLGDRLVAIADIKITGGMTWKDCFEIIKMKRMETTKEGKRKPLVIKFARQKDVEEQILKNKQKKKAQELKDRVRKARKKRGGKRAWTSTKKKNKSYGTRMASLKDLEKKYRNGGSADKTQEMCEELFDRIISKAESKEEKKCAHILKEIHTTEKNYVHDLYILNDYYVKRLTKKQVILSCRENASLTSSKFCEHGSPARLCSKLSSKKKPLLTNDDRKEMFMNVDVITKLNEELLRTIQVGLVKVYHKLEKGNKDVGVNDVVSVYSPAFLKLMPFYAMYSQYASRFPKAMDKFQTLKETNAEFVNELEAIERNKDLKSFNSLLIAPISRLTKYPLLFNTLTQAMRPYLSNVASKAIKDGKGDMDRLSKLVDDLDKTNRTVEKIASTVDYKVDEHSKNQVLSEIFYELGGVKYIKEFFKPSRKFVRRFENLIYEERKGTKIVQRRDKVLLVFNDMIIVGSYKKGSKKTLKGNGNKASVRVGVGSKRSVVRGGQSTIGKSDSKSLLSRSNSRGRGAGGAGNIFGSFVGLGKRSTAPMIKIEYKSEMKKVKVQVLSKPGPENKVGLQCYLTSVPNVDEIDGKTKRKKTLDLTPVVIKIEIFFETGEERDALVEIVREQNEKLSRKAETVRDAKETMGHARNRLREQRRRMQKGHLKGASSAASSASRQETLRQKLIEQRKKRSQKGN